MMEAFYKDEAVTIYNGDCREILPELPKVDLVLTDPPYMVSGEVTIHRSMNPKKYKYTGKDIVLNFGEWDIFKDEAQYWAFNKAWFTDMTACLREGGHSVIFFDLNKTTDLIRLAIENNCKMRQHLFWLKTNPVPRARKVDFMSAIEHACWFTKGERSLATFNYQLGQQWNVVQCAIPGNTTKDDGRREHPTQKPFKVIATWINYLSNVDDIILDPFLGSGVTAYTAKKLNRRCIGIEIEEKYCEIAADRCRQGVMKLN